MKTLKTIVTSCVILITFTGISQVKNKQTNVNYLKTGVTNLKIEVNAKSLQELEGSFSILDLETVFEDMEVHDDVEFKITCTKASDYITDSKKKISYKITGNVKDKVVFLKMANSIYYSAKKYYLD